MKQAFTYNQVVHLNAELREKELPYRINFKDETIIGIEELGICACIGKDGAMREAVRSFFDREGLGVLFSESGMELYICGRSAEDGTELREICEI